MSSIYVIGSLRNKAIQDVSNKIEESGIEAFSSWYAAGEFADDSWKAYEQSRGKTYEEALAGYAAQHVFQFDKTHLTRCDAAVLVLPAGRSGHLELGFASGIGKKTYILLDNDSDRWDVMYNFATRVIRSVDDLIKELNAS